ncbi:MAG: hypothetical protein P9F75_07275 [Candidatus Contendobacter sp.]|nr:hypothetical protein [Candidatus Contendobacter sp.]
MTTLRENWFAAGSAILARLQAQCAVFKLHATAPSLDVLGKLLTGITPAVYVVPGPSAGGVPPRQTWYVAVHARNVERLAEGSGLMDEAGAMVSRVMAALAHFEPGEEFAPLALPSEDHRYPDVGQGLYILTYVVQIEPNFWPYY